MKIAYAGAPDFSVAPVKKLMEAGVDIAAVITQPDKPVGRRAVLTPTPLKSFAQGAGIPVFTFTRIRDEVSAVKAIGADCMVTCAYGQILTQEILSAFPMGVYNIHASLLPRWRGASPIQHALAAGDDRTGITVMRTDVGLDTGDMLLQEEIPISPTDTAGSLSEKLSLLGGECIVRALTLIEKGQAAFTPQRDADATLCKKIRKDDCLVDFSLPAKQVSDFIRAMNPSPLAFSYLNGKLVNLWFAEVSENSAAAAAGEVFRADKTGIYVSAGENSVKITELQEEGGKRLRAADFVNGRKISVGDVFRRCRT